MISFIYIYFISDKTYIINGKEYGVKNKVTNVIIKEKEKSDNINAGKEKTYPLSLKTNPDTMINTDDLNICLNIISKVLERNKIKYELIIKKRAVNANIKGKVLFSSQCIENFGGTQTIFYAIASHYENDALYYTRTIENEIRLTVNKYNNSNNSNKTSFYPKMDVSINSTIFTKKHECLSFIKTILNNSKLVDAIEVIENKTKGKEAIFFKTNNLLTYFICSNYGMKNNKYKIFSAATSWSDREIELVYYPLMENIKKNLQLQK